MTPTPNDLDALRRALTESLRSGLLFGSLDEPLDDYGKRIVRQIDAALAQVVPTGEPAPTCATCRYLGQWRQHYAVCSHPRVPVQTLTQDKSAEFGCTLHEPKPTGGAQ